MKSVIMTLGGIILALGIVSVIYLGIFYDEAKEAANKAVDRFDHVFVIPGSSSSGN